MRSNIGDKMVNDLVKLFIGCLVVMIMIFVPMFIVGGSMINNYNSGQPIIDTIDICLIVWTIAIISFISYVVKRK